LTIGKICQSGFFFFPLCRLYTRWHDGHYGSVSVHQKRGCLQLFVVLIPDIFVGWYKCVRQSRVGLILDKCAKPREVMFRRVVGS
jgi:hypothetical protein